MSARTAFTEDVVKHLRLADRRLRAAEPGVQAVRYAICRTTLASITTVDSFYIGFFTGDSSCAFPYVYDHDTFQTPDVVEYSPHGLTHYVRSSARTYTFGSDQGSLLGRTVPFGNVEERSRDAVVTPLIDPVTQDVTGLMSIQSMTAAVYDEQIVAAVEWLGQALVTAVARDSHDSLSVALYTDHPELDSSRVTGEVDFVSAVVDRLAVTHRSLLRLQTLARDDDASLQQLASVVDDMVARNEQMQTEVVDMVRALRGDEQAKVSRVSASALRAALTPREAEIAGLIAVGSLTNAEIARHLHISLKTVKTHVGNILSKLGITQRSEIGYVLDLADDEDERES